MAISQNIVSPQTSGGRKPVPIRGPSSGRPGLSRARRRPAGQKVCGRPGRSAGSVRPRREPCSGQKRSFPFLPQALRFTREILQAPSQETARQMPEEAGKCGRRWENMEPGLDKGLQQRLLQPFSCHAPKGSSACLRGEDVVAAVGVVVANAAYIFIGSDQ